MRNLKIKGKILKNFSIILVLITVLGGLSLYAVTGFSGASVNLQNGVMSASSTIKDARFVFTNASRALARGSLYAYNFEQDSEKEKNLATLREELDIDLDNAVNLTTQYYKIVDLSPQFDNSTESVVLEKVNAINDIISNKYKPAADNAFNAINNGDYTTAITQLDIAESYSEEVISSIEQIDKLTQETLHIFAKKIDNLRIFGLTVVISLTVISVLLSILIAFITANSISKPLIKLSKSADLLANGDFTGEFGSNSTDEIGQLSNSILRVKDVFSELLIEIEAVSTEFENGSLNSTIDSSKFSGSYSTVTDKINETFDTLNRDLLDVISGIKLYGDGVFDADIKRFSGEKAVANESLDKVQLNLKNISQEIKSIIESMVDGDFSNTIDESRYSNEWKTIVDGLNTLTETVREPIYDTKKVLLELSKGNLNARMDKEYAGEFNEMKLAVNSSFATISSYILEINEVLGEVSNKNLVVGIDREYIGEFSAIKDAINNIIEIFNNIIQDINGAAVQIGAGAKQTSASSMDLAQGATEQGASVEQLTSMIDLILVETNNNADNSKVANELVQQTNTDAKNVNNQMKKLQDSMEEINKSSESISNIIKVIDDIAFQTNILALNAAVEAARAGQHGKGFAVVAEEVRTLAVRSQSAASEISELIEGTVDKVNEGSAITNITADALEKIVNKITEVSTLIYQINTSASNQIESANNINSGITNIAEVTQSNTATSEEQASSSEELLSQVEIFKETVSQFNLRKIQNNY